MSPAVAYGLLRCHFATDLPGRGTDGYMPVGPPFEEQPLERSEDGVALHPGEMSSTRHCADISSSKHTPVLNPLDK